MFGEGSVHASDGAHQVQHPEQQEEPDDYVIATGIQHSVREFVSLAAAEAGIALGWSGKGVDEVGYVIDENVLTPGAARLKRGQVLVRGQRHPIVGRICMDQFMVDIGPRGTAYNEDEVVLIDRQGGEAIRCEDVAAAAGTIPYEILVGLNGRIPRDYLGGA